MLFSFWVQVDLIKERKETILSRLPKRTWGDQQEKVDENWKNVRENIFQYELERCSIPVPKQSCQDCRLSPATIFCQDCKVGYICVDCDKKTHWCHPFHIRDMWHQGFFERVPPCQTVRQEEDGKFCMESFGKQTTLCM